MHFDQNEDMTYIIQLSKYIRVIVDHSRIVLTSSFEGIWNMLEFANICSCVVCEIQERGNIRIKLILVKKGLCPNALKCIYFVLSFNSHPLLKINRVPHTNNWTTVLLICLYWILSFISSLQGDAIFVCLYSFVLNKKTQVYWRKRVCETYQV